ncbi:MAG: HAMP domain-containing sensor histidine kinase [Minisyncoccales bacterium]
MNKILKAVIGQLDILGQCRKYNVPLRQCPQFLFLVMGGVIIIAVVVTYFVGIRYGQIDPEIIALIVIGLATVMLVISFIIVRSFEQLAEASRLKTEFVSIVSHQIRSPLTNLKWIVEILMSGILGKIEGKQEEYFRILKENLERMQTLVNDLLTVSRIEAAAFVLKREEFSMENVARDLIAEFEPIAKSSNIKIGMTAEPGLPKIYSDPFQVLQVLENLLYNAVRYMGFSSEKSDGERKVEVKLCRKGDYIYCEVQDSGIGIPKDDQKYIFQKFFRAENVRRYQTSGSGLGLYISKSIIERSGGKMGFFSREGSGATFWFRLPVPEKKNSRQ